MRVTKMEIMSFRRLMAELAYVSLFPLFGLPPQVDWPPGQEG